MTINEVSDKSELSESEAEDSATTSERLPADQHHSKPNYVRILKDINTSIKRANFTIVIGDIGSGKSSLLLSILNEMVAGDDSRI